MDKTNSTMESNEGDLARGPRYERNRKYYLKNTHASLRSTLLHNIKTRGRVPSIKTTQKYCLLPEELMKQRCERARKRYSPKSGRDRY